MIGAALLETGWGFIALSVLAVLTFLITVLALVVSRKYLKTRISLSLEVERDPNPHYNGGSKNGRRADTGSE